MTRPAETLRELIKIALIERCGVPDDPLAAALADAALAAIEAAGFVVVPAEPTNEMEHAGWECVNRDLEDGHSQTLRDLYRAMLASRPRDLPPTDKSDDN